jgi:hypothetical protein
MSFNVQISPFVHLFTLKIVFRWGLSPLNPHQGSVPDLLEALSGHRPLAASSAYISFYT